jgi:hypothetical protein
MKKKGPIHKDHALKHSQDFKLLMEQGIRHVQGFSGDRWTDYNLHDPGVTILEQFCYGLTDLGYKTAFPIEDLLIEKSDGKINWDKNAFFSPSLVFSSHPITVSDFRKLLIDSFPEIQNCWLSQVSPTGMEEGLNGVYGIEILPALAFQKDLKKKPELARTFLDSLQQFLNSNRNLCEDFDPPRLLSPKPIFIKASVEVLPETDPDRIMAEIIFALEVFLYHPVAYSNLEELRNSGHRIEDIFSGPKLTRGFILDTQLKERGNVLNIEQFQGLISKISGVKKCHDLALDIEGKEKSIILPEGFYASINTDPKDPSSVYYKISIVVDQNRQRLNSSRVADLLLELWSKNFRVYQEDLFKNSFWKSSIKGRYRNPEKYVSIQHHFPKIYGLGREGLSQHEAPERHAKVRQLKGYLMLMEKHLANYLAQLSRVPDFFDHDIQQEEQTYFSQDFETQVGKDEIEIKENLRPGFDNEGVNPQTGESRIDWLKRKNRILDHLLARFGERVQDLPFQLSLKMNISGTQEEMLAFQLLQKSRFLRMVPELNYAKHRARFNLVDQGDIRSTVEVLLYTLLGIPFKNDSLLPDFLTKDVTLEGKEINTGFLKSQISYTELKEKYRPLYKIERNFPLLENSEKPHFSFGKIGIKDLFARTLNPDCYWISKKFTFKGSIEVLFQKSDSNWVGVWEGKNEDEAVKTIANAIQYFREMNQRSEGMYFVDHIALRTLLEASGFGFVLMEQDGEPTFKSPWYPTATKRKEQLELFYLAAKDRKAYRREGNMFSLHDVQGKLLGTYQSDGSVDLEAVFESTSIFAAMMSGDQGLAGFLSFKDVEDLRFMGTLHNEKIVGQRTLVLLQKRDDGTEIKENFFDLKASLILPDWPARFQENHFKDFVENEVRERIPAHVKVGIHWLDLREFEAFENIYLKWRGELNNNPDKVKSKVALQLYTFLSKLKGVDNE